MTTLAALISGMVGSKSTQLPSVATKIPDGAKPESRVKRFTRWLDNERILEEVYFLPYVDILLTQLALETLVVVMDGDRLRPQLIELTIFALTLLGPSGGVATNLSWASATRAERKDSSLCACPRERRDNSSTSA